MPNHVTNIVDVTADNATDLSRFLDLIAGDTRVIDFNKVIPMPTSLNIVDGSLRDNAVVAYLSNNGGKKLTPALRKKCIAYGVTNRFASDWPQKAYERTIEMIEKDGKDKLYSFGSSRDDELRMTLYDAGAVYVSNVDKYGALTWYSWCCENWDTKWNAYDADLGKNSETSATIFFLTAWSAPHSVIDAMAEQHPELSFSHKWADEDVGSNCGYAEYKNGECVDGKAYDYQREQEEATNFACDILGMDPSLLDEDEEE